MPPLTSPALALAAAVVTWGAVTVLERRCPPSLRDRSDEARGKPRIGGLAILMGLAVALPLDPAGWRVLLPVALATMVGLHDDATDSPPVQRLLLLGVIAVGAACLSLPPELFASPVNLPVLGMAAIPIAFFILCVTVGFDFIDGLDGLAPGLVLVALVPVLWMAPAPWLVAATASAATYLALSNRPPAKTLLGDAGSNGLGMLAALAVLHPRWAQVPAFLDERHDFFGPDPFSVWAGPLALVGLVAVPLLDLVTTIVRRLRIGDLPSGERGHMHYRLADLHDSARLAVLELVGVGALCGVVATISFLMPWRIPEAVPGALLALSLLLWRTRATRPAPSDSR
ncbi:MAG: hypothetical protein KDA24_10220 [Deltaproteobacteria bacterium]|nr:hypothetical protein [Deltaproteobacteria bacterium]